MNKNEKSIVCLMLIMLYIGGFMIGTILMDLQDLNSSNDIGFLMDEIYYKIFPPKECNHGWKYNLQYGCNDLMFFKKDCNILYGKLKSRWC